MLFYLYSLVSVFVILRTAICLHYTSIASIPTRSVYPPMAQSYWHKTLFFVNQTCNGCIRPLNSLLTYLKEQQYVKTAQERS